MKREIKFRGKTESSNEWVFGDLIQENSGRNKISTNLSTWSLNKDDVEPYGEEFIVIDETIGQYTELKDKNGKEVYEGDIVRVQEYHNSAINLFSKDEVIQLTYEDVKGGMTEEWIGEVKYGESCYYVGDTYLSGFHGDMRLSSPIYEIEVIGNIFDNKKLLEKWNGKQK